MRSYTVAKIGILSALALVLSFVEAQIPVFFAVPGMKLGLTNVVVLTALYLLDEKKALIINLVRIVLAFLLFGTAASLLYSLAGGFLSLAVMILLKNSRKFQIVTVSIAGGISHNIGQIIAAMILLDTSYIAWYLIILWFTGIASGAIIGVLGAEIIKRLKTHLKE